MTEWLRSCAPAAPDAVRLVCFPHAGGAASYFLPLARALSPDVAVLAVQYPGRHDRRAEPVVADLRILARSVADEVAALPPGRLAFLGHSMGAIVAFETALVGETGRGRRPDMLLASGARAPGLPRLDRAVLASDDTLAAEVIRLGGTRPEVLADRDLRDLIMPAIRGDYRALLSYAHRPGALLTCPVTAMVGDRDPRVTVDQADLWREATSGRFELRVFGGGHFYLGDEPAEVASMIRLELSTSV